MFQKIITHILFVFVTLLIPLVYAIPLYLAFPFMVLCLWLFYWRKQRAEVAMLLVSLIILFGCLEIFVRLNANDIFYREHEKWALKNRYRANIHDTILTRFGDLVAVEPSLKDTLSEPHALEFITDSSGYRNRHDYTNEPYVLLGDSFTATINNTQPDILVEQLNARLPGYFYSLGFPGAPKEYENNALTFMERGHKHARFLWFVFEGNDFDAMEAPRRLSKWAYYKGGLSLRALPFMTTRVLTVFYKAVGARLKRSPENTVPSQVDIFQIGGQSVGFLKRYMDAAAVQKRALSILGTEEALSSTACVFFVPDKYRVYKKWIKNGPAISEPAAGLVALKEYFTPRNITVVDLTPVLQKAAAEQLADQKFVYWRDDTHWNRLGIQSIVSEVERCVAKDKARLKEN